MKENCNEKFDLIDEMHEEMERLGAEKKYVDLVNGIYFDAMNKAEQNKRDHFKWVNRGFVIMLILGFIYSVYLIINNSKMVSFSAIILSIVSFLGTIVVILKDFKQSRKKSETWVRHRLHQMDIYYEAYKFVFKTDEYRGIDDKQRLELFQDHFLEIGKNNEKRFENNMRHFDK